MDKSNVKKRPNEADARANFTGQEANKIRKVTQTGSVEAKLETEKQITNDEELSGIDNKPSLEVLLNGISNFELCDKIIASVTKQLNQKHKEHPSTSHGGSPVTFAIGDDNCDITSDSGSDFCPDWSSAGSFTSSANLDDVDSSDDDVTSVNKKSNYLILDLDDERTSHHESGLCKTPFYEIYRKTKQVASLPIPAAGNDDVDDVCMTSQPANSDDGKSNDRNKFKPQAIRRVKSMIYETGLDNEIAADQRMRVLMRKQVTDVVHRSTSPVALSPLLSVEDVVALKCSSSQISAKYSLKRSRSNLAVTAAFFKRPITVPNDVIHEEIDEDKQDKEINETIN